MPTRVSTRKHHEEIIVLGDLNADVVGRVHRWPQPGEECLAERVELHCGGVGANCALALRRWGISPQLIGCVGRDAFGEVLLETLNKHGVGLRWIQRTNATMTGFLYIHVTRDGQRTFFGSRGANGLLQSQPRNSSLLNQPSSSGPALPAILMGYSFLDAGPRKAAKQLLRAVHQRGGWVALDVGVEPACKVPRQILGVLKHVDLLFASSQEAAALTGRRNPRDAFAQLRKAGAREVVIKLGKRGCLIQQDRVTSIVPTFAVKAVDSTGAGDAFTAAFLQARLRGWSAAEAAVAGNAAGAAAAAVVGAGESLPTLRQIAHLLRSQRLNGSWDARRLQVLRRLLDLSARNGGGR
jgi:ribokinase